MILAITGLWCYFHNIPYPHSSRSKVLRLDVVNCWTLNIGHYFSADLLTVKRRPKWTMFCCSWIESMSINITLYNAVVLSGYSKPLLGIILIVKRYSEKNVLRYKINRLPRWPKKWHIMLCQFFPVNRLRPTSALCSN